MQEVTHNQGSWLAGNLLSKLKDAGYQKSKVYIIMYMS